MLEDNDDAANLRSTLDAMAIIGLTEQEREDVLTVVAAVLHLGNVTFMGNDRDEARPNGPAALEALAILSHLLKVRPHTSTMLSHEKLACIAEGLLTMAMALLHAGPLHAGPCSLQNIAQSAC